jgi:hypothetical protein
MAGFLIIFQDKMILNMKYYYLHGELYIVGTQYIYLTFTRFGTVNCTRHEES